MYMYREEILHGFRFGQITPETTSSRLCSLEDLQFIFPFVKQTPDFHTCVVSYLTLCKTRPRYHKDLPPVTVQRNQGTADLIQSYRISLKTISGML